MSPDPATMPRMATMTEVILACDICEAENETVETHSLVVDGKARTLEACKKDWDKKPLKALFDAARPVKK
jgi:hypothetical protein